MLMEGGGGLSAETAAGGSAPRKSAVETGRKINPFRGLFLSSGDSGRPHWSLIDPQVGSGA